MEAILNEALTRIDDLPGWAQTIALTLLAFAGTALGRRAVIGFRRWLAPEESPALKAAMQSLSDDNDNAMADKHLLVCDGLTVALEPDGKVQSITVGATEATGTRIEDVLKGGVKGREYKRVAARALERHKEVIERDRQRANAATASQIVQPRQQGGATSRGATLHKVAEPTQKRA